MLHTTRCNINRSAAPPPNAGSAPFRTWTMARGQRQISSISCPFRNSPSSDEKTFLHLYIYCRGRELPRISLNHFFFPELGSAAFKRALHLVGFSGHSTLVVLSQFSHCISTAYSGVCYLPTGHWAYRAFWPYCKGPGFFVFGAKELHPQKRGSGSK